MANFSSEDALLWLDRAKTIVMGNVREEVVPQYKAAFEAAAAAVKEAGDNAPLTEDELLNMNGEPVYINLKYKDGTTNYMWALVAVATETVFFYTNYGFCWVYSENMTIGSGVVDGIYRRQPKETNAQ